MVRRTVQFVVGCCLLLIAAGGFWWSYQRWGSPSPDAEQATALSNQAKNAADKIIVGEQAQKNLGITAKPLRTETFWKSITVPGMIVDRPGISDREVVAPATGIVSRLLHVPGDTVRPGDQLFVLSLASEALHETQSDLFKTSEDLRLARVLRDRLASVGESIARARVIEVESQISRLEAAAKASREELLRRAFSNEDIDRVSQGIFVREIIVATPRPIPGQALTSDAAVSTYGPAADEEQPFAYEVQELQVVLGEQVQAGQTLCHLSSHRSLAIEGRAFRDETSLLERSIEHGWSVEVDFQEDASSDWPATEGDFPIRYIANSIDPVTRTFAFLMPLKNQFKEVIHGDTTQLLWRFRPGQKVALRIRVEKIDGVFVLPADAVVFEGADAFVFTQNVNTFERKSIHVLFRDHDQVVVADDGALPSYAKGQDRWTIPAICRTAAAQLNRMTKAGSSGAPKGYHIHADGSLHKNEDEAK